MWRPIHLHHFLSRIRIAEAMLFQMELVQEYFLIVWLIWVRVGLEESSVIKRSQKHFKEYIYDNLGVSKAVLEII